MAVSRRGVFIRRVSYGLCRDPQRLLSPVDPAADLFDLPGRLLRVSQQGLLCRLAAAMGLVIRAWKPPGLSVVWHHAWEYPPGRVYRSRWDIHRTLPLSVQPLFNPYRSSKPDRLCHAWRIIHDAEDRRSIA